MVPTNNFGLPRPATPALAGIGIASPLVSEAATVPPSALCMEKHNQYLGPAPANTYQAPVTLPDYAVVAVRPLINPASEEAAVLCPASPCTESSSASPSPASAPTAPAIAHDLLDSDPLLSTASSIASTIQRAPCLDSFLAGNQLPTLYPPPSTANHLVSPLLKEYAELGCPAGVGPDWPLTTIISATATVPHASTLTPEATAFF